MRRQQRPKNHTNKDAKIYEEHVDQVESHDRLVPEPSSEDGELAVRRGPVSASID